MEKEKTGKRKTVRGSVLFTTVSVMAMLIIFLTGALALASSASNRAHKSYASSQASYNARAAIDSFTQAMINDPGVAAAVHDMGNSSLQPVLSIGTDEASLAAWENATSKGWGTIGYYDAAGNFHEGQLNVTPITGNDRYAWDEEKGEWVKLTQFKITATARYGREEETLVAYINTAINKESSINIKGLQTMSDTSFVTNDYVTGGFGLNIGSDTKPCEFLNSFTLNTELAFINGDLAWNSQAIYNATLFKNSDKASGYSPSQMIVLGNLKTNDNTPAIVNVTYDKNLLGTSFGQRDIPFLYVDGQLKTGQSLGSVVKGNMAPFNVFAGSVDIHQGNFSSADLYLMDKDATSKIGAANESSLYKWTTNMSGDSNFNSSGGNVYCNGNLEINKATIYGDVRVRGNCNIKGNTKIYGNLIVGGNLTTNGNIVKMVTGKVYAGTTADADAETVKDGYEVHENVYHENELRPGYTLVGTYNNVDLENLIPEETHGEPAVGYRQVAVGNGTYRMMFEGNEVPYRVFDWNETNTPITVYWQGPEYDNLYLTKPYYLVAIDGTPTDVIVSDPEVTYYTRDEDGAEVDASEAVGDFYTEWNNPDATTTEQYYYYRVDDATGGLIKLENGNGIYETGKINSISAYPTPDEIYPHTMTREAIYGSVDDSGVFVPAPTDTKLITTLEEAREALGLRADGSINKKNLDTKSILQGSLLWDFDNHKVDADADVIDLPTNHNENYTKTNSFVLKGGAGNYTYKININPAADMYVLIDEATLGSNSEIIVNNRKADGTLGPTVTFIIKGNFNLANNGAIISSVISEGCDVKYTDDFGMYFYGLEGTEDIATDDNGFKNYQSKITFTNNATISGCIKAPYTTFVGNVKGRYSINYTNENGQKSKMQPVIIGNALVKESTAQNDFGLAYTKSGANQGGNNNFYSATGDKYQLMYYAAS